jgi:hypothetical protein
MVSVLAMVALNGLRLAVTRQQAFYTRALERDAAELQAAAHQFEVKASALYSDTKQENHWKAVFTADEINGWLAAAGTDRQSHLRSVDVREPRVAISPSGILLGFRSTRAGIETVVSLEMQVMLTEPDLVAIRLLNFRAGVLPLPLGKIAEDLRQITSSLDYPVRWTQHDGCPLALVDMSMTGRPLTIETVELLDGELYIAGSTSLGVFQQARDQSEDQVSRQ